MNPGPDKKILIFDRRRKSGEILLKAFRNHGFRAELVDDPQKLLSCDYDAVITEVQNIESIMETTNYASHHFKVLVFSNFSRDEYIEQLYEHGIRVVLEKSYKVRDILRLTHRAVSKNDPESLFGLHHYFESKREDNGPDWKRENVIFHRKYRDTSSILSRRVSEDLDRFLFENALQRKVRDIEMLRLAIGELIDNSIQSQMQNHLTEIRIELEFAYDREKVGFSIHNRLHPIHREALFASLHRRMKLDDKNFSNNEYSNGTYVGRQGRGFYIIQKGVHLLSILLLDEEAARRYRLHETRYEATIIVYFNKDTLNLSSLSNTAISMVMTL